MNRIQRLITLLEHAILRKHPHYLKRYLVRIPREVLFSAQVDGSPTLDPDTQGIISFHYKNESGIAAGLVPKNLTIDIGTAPGLSNVGKFRVRDNPVADTKTIYVNETAVGSVPVADNMYISIVKEHLIWQKRIRRVITSDDPLQYDEYTDYDLAYGGQNDVYLAPICNVTKDEIGNGVDYAGFPEPGETYRLVDLSLFFSFHPDGSPITTYEWVLDDDITLEDGYSTSDATIRARFPIGYYEIRANVVGGLSEAERHIPIITLEDEDDPALIRKFAVDSDSRAEGRDMSFTIQDENIFQIDRSNPLIYFEKVKFKGTTPNTYVGQFIGWATQDSVNLKLFRSIYKLTVGGPQAWLDKLGGYPQTVYDQRYPDTPDTTSNKWIEMPNNTPDKMVHYILRIYTTALLVMNLYFSDYQVPIEGYTSEQGSIWSQIVGVVKRYFGMAAVDSGGALWLNRHYDYLEANERAAIDPVSTIDKRDWLDEQAPDITTSHVEEYNQVDLYGSNFDISFDTDGNIVDFSHVHRAQAPGIVQGAGLSSEAPASVFLRPTSVAESQLAKLAGHHLARLNNKRPDASLSLNGNYDIIEPAWGLPIKLNHVDDVINGLSIVNRDYLVKSVSVSHSNEPGKEPKAVTWSVEEATSGDPAVSIPDVLQQPTTVDYPPEARYPAPGSGPPLKTTAIDYASNAFARTTAWTIGSGAATWENISTGTITGTCIDYTADPFDYRRYFLLTTTGLFRCDNVWTATPVWTVVALNLALFGNALWIGKMVRMSINRAEFITISTGGNGCVTSLDYGATWRRRSVVGDAYDPTVGGHGLANYVSTVDIAVSPYNDNTNGWIYAYARAYGYAVSKSEDWGDTWTVISGGEPDTAAGGCLNVPYIRADGTTPNINDASQEVICVGGVGHPPNIGYLWRSSAGAIAGSWVLLRAGEVDVGGAKAFSGAIIGSSVDTYTWDGNEIITGLLYTRAGGAGAAVIFMQGGTSGNGIALGGDENYIAHVAGFPTSPNYMIANSEIVPAIVYTLDKGVNWIEMDYPLFFVGGPARVTWDLSDYIDPVSP